MMICQECDELLALHVFDDLEVTQREAVEGHLAACEECRASYLGVQEAMCAIGHGAPPQPLPGDLKERLFERIATVPRSVLPSPRRSWGWQAASVVLAISFATTLAGLGLLRGQLSQVEGRNAMLAASLANRQEQLAILLAQNVHTASLRAPGQPQAAARVYWAPGHHAWVVAVAGLPPAVEGKTYQLWAVTAKAKISMGTFQTSSRGTAILHPQSPPARTPIIAAAVSMEPAGGVPQPTGPIVLVGKI